VCVLGAALTAGCADDPTTPTLEAQLITPEGESPFALGSYDRLHILFDQEGSELVDYDLELDEDDFRVPFPLDPDVRSRIRVALERGTETWVGAPPRFFPGDGYTEASWLVRIVMGRPGTCAVVTPYEEDVARADVAHLRVGVYVFHFGGRTASGNSAAVTVSDHLWVTSGTSLVDLPEPAGRTKAAMAGTFSTTTSTLGVVLSDGGNWTYVLTAASLDAERAQTLVLHEGAGPDSALMRREAQGDVFVAGGVSGDMPVAGLSRVSGSGGVTTGNLMAPRSGATAVPMPAGALVVGGDRRAGAPFGELVDLSTFATAAVEAPAEAEEVRSEPVVVQGGESLWVLGGTDAEGAALETTWVVRGCPATCAVEAGPTLTLASAPTAEGDVVTADGSVWRAVETGGWHLEPIADLVHPRVGAGLVPYESGGVWIQGGTDPSGAPRRDAELCYPAELSALD